MEDVPPLRMNEKRKQKEAWGEVVVVVVCMCEVEGVAVQRLGVMEKCGVHLRWF